MVVFDNIKRYTQSFVLTAAVFTTGLIVSDSVFKNSLCDAFVIPVVQKGSSCGITKKMTNTHVWKQQTLFFVNPVASTTSKPLRATLQKQEEEEDLQSYLDLDRYSSLHDFHQAMERLCAQCSAFEHPRELKSGKRSSRLKHIDVLSVASLVQTMWEKSLTLCSLEHNDPRNKWYPNHVTFSLVVKAWSKAGISLIMEPNMGRAQTIAQKMKYAFLEDEQQYEIVSAVDAMNHAEDLLLKHIYNYNNTSKDLLHGINVVIDGWAKMARYSTDIIDEMNPDGNGSHKKHSHHLSSYESAQKAQNLFNQLFVQRKSTQDDDDTESKVNGDDKKEENNKKTTLKPDMITYTSLIEAWANADYDKAEALTYKLVQKYVASTSKDEIVDRPTIRLANCLMHAHAKATASLMEIVMKTYASTKEEKSKKYILQSKAISHAKQAHSILNNWKALYEEHKLVEFRPDVTSYTTVMDSYAKCAQIDSVKEAEGLLEELEELHKANPEVPSLQPNTKTYTTMIAAWSRTNSAQSPEKAQAILEHMKEMSKDSNLSVEPNARTYTSVISAWARSQDSTKAVRALKLLKEMQDIASAGGKGSEDTRPTLFTYNAVLDACAKTRGTNEQLANALKIAFAIHKSMLFHSKKKSNNDFAAVKPNHITYATLFKATYKLIPESGEERNAIVRALFEHAKRAGQIDRYVITNMQLAAEVDLFRELMGPISDRNGFMHYDQIPHEWNKNVSRNNR